MPTASWRASTTPTSARSPDAEARFKAVAEAYEALNDAERRAAYDDVGQRYKKGESFEPPPGWASGFEFSGADGGDAADAFAHSAFFEALFRGERGAAARPPRPPRNRPGGDHHARVQIDLEDAYRGGRRSLSLRTPMADAQGRGTLQDRQLDVNIPKGIRVGQHLRLAGQGEPGHGEGAAGDLYLEIEFAPHRRFRVDGRDVHVDLPISPWEAALGASVTVATPDGSVELSVPRGSSAGRKLRLRGKGLPSDPAGDLYAVVTIALPPADTAPAEAAYRAMAAAFAGFDPRQTSEA